MDPSLIDVAMDPPVGYHEGRRFRLSQTTCQNVSIMLKAAQIPTKLRLGYLHSCLFRSSTPPGEEPFGPALIDWDEVVYCRHGSRQRLHGVGADDCGCTSTLPAATASVVRAFIGIMDGLAAARDTFDWTIPSSTVEQDLAESQIGVTPNKSMVGELLAEFEHSWKVLIMRVPGAAPHGTPGDLPEWWSTGVRAEAAKANLSWLTAFRGTGARGARPLAGDVDRCAGLLYQQVWLHAHAHDICMSMHVPYACTCTCHMHARARAICMRVLVHVHVKYAWAAHTRIVPHAHARCDDVFNSTGWLLQAHRLAQIQTELAAVPAGEPTCDLAFDDQGWLRLIPKAGMPSTDGDEARPYLDRRPQ